MINASTNPTWKFVAIFISAILNNVVAASENSSCQINRNALLKWTTVQSPGFPQKFPRLYQCQWRIATSKHYRVKVQFTRFSLLDADQSGVCDVQWIRIVDPEGKNKESFSKICGKLKPGTFVSTGNSLIINLRSVAPIERTDYTGFEFMFVATLDFPTISGKSLATRRRSSADKNIESNKLNAGQKQSNTIEYLNELRNNMFYVPENPNLNDDEFPIEFDENDLMANTAVPPTVDGSNVPSSLVSNKLVVLLVAIGIVLLCICLWILYYRRKRKNRRTRATKNLQQPNHQSRKQQTKNWSRRNFKENDKVISKKSNIDEVTTEPVNCFYINEEKIEQKSSTQQKVQKTVSSEKADRQTNSCEQSCRSRNCKHLIEIHRKHKRELRKNQLKSEDAAKPYHKTKKSIPKSKNPHPNTHDDIAKLRLQIRYNNSKKNQSSRPMPGQ